MTQGPNVKKLIVRKMSTIAIPANTKGGLASAMSFLMSREAIMSAAFEATAWVGQAIELVRQAADPNPWRKSSDEEIAGEILRRLEQGRGELK